MMQPVTYRDAVVVLPGVRAVVAPYIREVQRLREEVRSYKESAETGEYIERFWQKKHDERVARFVATQKPSAGTLSPVFYSPDDSATASPFPAQVQCVLDELDAVIGQTHLKRHFTNLCYRAVKQKKLKSLLVGSSTTAITYHMVFSGDPGTGKTMIARLAGRLLLALGVIPAAGAFHTVPLHKLKAQYLGQTPHLMAKTFKEPGVYFIDEAYSIMGRKDDVYGAEILSGLCEIAENRRHEVVIILAGYKSHMDELFAHNPGLASRFHWRFEFHAYSADELLQIAEHSARQMMQHTFDGEALEELRKDLVQGVTNARDVRNYVEAVECCQCVRVARTPEYTLDMLLRLTLADVVEARKQRVTVY